MPRASCPALPRAPRPLLPLSPREPACWALASCLITPLTARSVGRHLRPRVPLCYRPDLWMIVFPAGMYAIASMLLGAVSGLPFIRHIGTAAAWPAAAAWALTFTVMIVSLARPTRDGQRKYIAVR